MGDDCVEFEYREAQFRLHLPTVTLKTSYKPSRSSDLVRAFSHEGFQPSVDALLVGRALSFAAKAHASIDQRRKYTNESYIVHPIAVAEIVKSVPHTPEMVAAALLHDVAEDTPKTIRDIYNEFGEDVAELVYWLTDVSKPSDGNRAKRKQMDLEHISKAPPAAKTIKIADLIDNTKTIKERDPDFWRVYRHEKLRLLEVLKEGDATLWARAAEQCEEE